MHYSSENTFPEEPNKSPKLITNQCHVIKEPNKNKNKNKNKEPKHKQSKELKEKKNFSNKQYFSSQVTI